MPAIELNGGQAALAAALLETVRKDPREWSRGDDGLLLSVYLPGNRANMLRLLALVHHYMDRKLTAPIGQDLIGLARLQLIAGLDWNRVLNPHVRTSWRASFRARQAEVKLEREIQRQMARG